eukprot:gene34296-44299_t
MSEFSTSPTVNALLGDWSHLQYELPPFNELKPGDFEEALKTAMKQHIADLKEISESKDLPTFENTIVKFDRSGKMLSRTSALFENLCSSNGVPELQTVELAMAAPLAAHHNQVYTFPNLFSRINQVYEVRAQAQLTSEQLRLVERIHLDFVRAGAKFDSDAQAKYAKITEELAELTTKFMQNVLADESDIYLTLESDEDKVGLAADILAASRQAAIERNVSGENSCVITLSRSLVVPFLTFSERRDLREKAWRLWTSRGELDPARDNIAVAKKILQLREEQAKMHGYETFAHYANADTMAGHPSKVQELLERVWGPAKLSLKRERSELESFIKQTGIADGAIDIKPWDWRYYAEKVRQSNYNLDEADVKPYFPLEKMVAAIFDCAGKLFGLSFRLRPDIVAYHPDVQVYEVVETVDGQEKIVAIFLHDNYARQYKHSGAWMNSFRNQYIDENGDSVIPIVINNNNFNKGGDGQPTLLSFDDAVTLFHEFGHGLHGMLSKVTYERLSGTSVLKDFVELPSQLYEHWLSQEVVLKAHARHFATDEPIPDELLARMRKARKFNEGFSTVEYTASALVDTALHKASAKDIDIAQFEVEELQRLGMPEGIIMRHRPAHFQHLFSGGSYAAAYYVYLWAEVLDADGFDAFLETGDCFNKDVASRLRKYIYSSGNTLDPAEAFRLFRGRDPEIGPMLKKKGLAA